MPVNYHPRVREELNQAVTWYERQQSGLGERFLDAFEAAVHEIVNDPTRIPFAAGQDRQVSLKVFPYGLVFRTIRDGVCISCLRHHSRHPRFGFGRK